MSVCVVQPLHATDRDQFSLLITSYYHKVKVAYTLYSHKGEESMQLPIEPL